MLASIISILYTIRLKNHSPFIFECFFFLLYKHIYYNNKRITSFKLHLFIPHARNSERATA